MARSAFFHTLLAGLILTCTTAAPLSAEEAKQPDVSKLQAALGGNSPDSVQPTPVPGLYEVTFGAQVIYLSADGRFVIQGDVVDLVTAKNLTEARLNGLRSTALGKLSEGDMIIFTPPGETKHTVTVFTDIDCGYCRKLHSEISSYLDQGIRVRYLAFPRTGLNTESYDKAVSAWCAQNRNDAITRAKRGEELPAATCPNPVSQQYKLGEQLGVRGTPSIILESGQMVPGYVPADRLAQMLDQR
jgi:thiol:disulfide interchange protein DsbC